jgi:Carboxypeptidase regulatory-like domain
MTTRLRSLFVFALAVSVGLCAAWPEAADQAQQTRDTPGQAQAGTAVLTGVVISNDTDARPIRRVSVSLNGGNLRASRTALTDDSGAFIFTGLPSGTYSANASKPAWLSSQYSESGRGPVTPIKLTEGQRLAITIRITRSAVISGTIRDPLGRPIANVRARVMRYVAMNGQRVLQATSGTGGSTDDRGMYRIYGLQPGDYVISAVPQPMPEVRPVSEEEIRWAKSRLSTASMPGNPMTPGATVAPPPAPAQTIGYAPVYFPGTTDPMGATTITLRAGDERSGVDIPLQYVPTAKIEGTLVGPDGRPTQNAQVSLVPGGKLMGQSLDLIMSVVNISRPTPDGKFAFTSVPPGQFIVVARGTNQGQGPMPVMIDRLVGISGAPPPPPPPPPPIAPNAMTLWAIADVEVNGHDLSGLAMTLRPGVKVTGRILFDGSILPPPAEIVKTRLTIAPAQNNLIGGGSGAAQVAIDGTFMFQNMVPGKYRISGSAPVGMTQNMGWQAKSVMVNGRDALDFPFEIADSDLAGVVVTFTDRFAEIGGSLFDAAGKPVVDYSVVLIPADRNYWVPGSRRIRSIRPGAEGKYRFASLPAGEYCLIAVADMSQIDMTDPAILEQLAAAAYKITIVDGEKKVQDLKLAR